MMVWKRLREESGRRPAGHSPRHADLGFARVRALDPLSATPSSERGHERHSGASRGRPLWRQVRHSEAKMNPQATEHCTLQGKVDDGVPTRLRCEGHPRRMLGAKKVE